MITVLGVTGWPVYARIHPAETFALREREFVLAARALGMSHARIIFRQILPNLVSPIVVVATLQIAQVIILESFLSFLGLGVSRRRRWWAICSERGASTCSTRGGSPPSPASPSSSPRS